MLVEESLLAIRKTRDAERQQPWASEAATDLADFSAMSYTPAPRGACAAERSRRAADRYEKSEWEGTDARRRA